MLIRHLRPTLLAGLALLGTLSVTAAVAMAVTPGVYKGGSRTPANRYMDIQLQVLRGSRRANWRIDVSGPCTENERLGRTVGTDAGSSPPDPRLKISNGRFLLRKHAIDTLDGLHYGYTLAGHAVAGGFAGTFRYTESQGAYNCDSLLLHWRARRSDTTFP
jgi:hypothetical protein